MAHRNIARVLSQMGDTRGALEHNLESVHIEASWKKPTDSSALRAAAGIFIHHY